MSNIIQFSMDQLHEAPTTEVTAFIVWYIWTWNFGFVCQAFLQYCSCGAVRLILTLVLPTSLSLALCLDFFFGHWLIKEPVGQNPYKLFLGVLRYAVRNKYPRQRSAFTYWEDQPYSRIDLAKDKYGGPFTTEQVEDVKIVLRMLVIITVACIGAGLFITMTIRYSTYPLSSFDKYINNTMLNCSTNTVVACINPILANNFYFRSLVILLFVPIHEFLI